MNRIYHRYELWEDYKAGFYDNVGGKNKAVLIDKVVELFTDKALTKKYMEKVITDWPYSCEHNLTNDALNKIAYLGQAACCIYAGVTSSITMEAWHKVPKENRDIADAIAKEIVDNYKPKTTEQLCLRLD